MAHSAYSSGSAEPCHPLRHRLPTLPARRSATRRGDSAASGNPAENPADPKHLGTDLSFVRITATRHHLRDRDFRLALPRNRHIDPASHGHPTVRIRIAGHLLAQSVAPPPPIGGSGSTSRWFEAEGRDRYVPATTVSSTDDETELMTVASNALDDKQNPPRPMAELSNA